jgi:hypothetical protein
MVLGSALPQTQVSELLNNFLKSNLNFWWPEILFGDKLLVLA